MNTQSLIYNHSKKLLRVKAIAPICMADLLLAINNLPGYFENHGELKVLLDFSDTEVRITRKELPYIANSLQEIILPENYIRIAKIVSKPYDTALAILFQNMIQDISQLKFEIFNTNSAAMKWLIN